MYLCLETATRNCSVALVKDNVLIVEDVDERQHKSNCERSFTLMH